MLSKHQQVQMLEVSLQSSFDSALSLSHQVSLGYDSWNPEEEILALECFFSFPCAKFLTWIAYISIRIKKKLRA
jgi:hypothetical protein